MNVLYHDNSKKSGIYKITNTINNRVYYGSTNKFSSRFYHHISYLRKGKHNNTFLQNDFNKCGEEAFIIEVVEVVEKEFLLEIEQKYLDKFFDNKKLCYNIQPIVGKNTVAHTPETKRKIGEKSVLAWKNMSQEDKEELSVLRKEISAANWKNEEYRSKLLIKFKENSFKISAAQKEKAATKEGKEELMKRLAKANEKRPPKEIKVISPIGEIITIFNLYKWCRDNNISYEGMRWITRGTNNSYKGWKLFIHVT